MSAIANLLIEQARIAAESRARSGALWGNAISGITQVPGQVMAADEQRREKMQASAIAASRESREAALSNVQLQNAQQMQTDRGTVDQLWADPTIYKPDGTINREGLTAKLATANAGHLAPAALETADRLDESRASLLQKAQTLRESQRETLGKEALQLESAGNDPGLFHLTVASLSKPDVGIIPKEQADAWLQAATPEQVAAITKSWKAGTKSGQPKIGIAPEGATPFYEEGPNAGKPVPGFTVTPKPPTGPELDAAAQALYAKKAKGVALTPDEAATLKGYEDRKRVVSDPAQIAATERQTRTIAQQNSLGQENHDFAVKQKARADINSDANKPFQDAQSSAQELRDIVTSAQSGNKVAGALQSLQTASTLLRSNGIKRLNMAEINMPATAGSALDRFQGFIGKYKDGEPVPPAIQKDMLQVADILEAGARKKYEATHNGVNALYGTNIPLTYPATTPAAAPIKVGGFSVVVK